MRLRAILAVAVVMGIPRPSYSDPDIAGLERLAKAIQAGDAKTIESLAQTAEDAVTSSPPDERAKASLAVGQALAIAGRKEAALGWADRSVSEADGSGPARIDVLRRSAALALRAGDSHRARKFLELALAESDRTIGSDDPVRRFLLLDLAEVDRVDGEVAAARDREVEAARLSALQSRTESAVVTLGGAPRLPDGPPPTHEMVRVFYAAQRATSGSGKDPSKYFTSDRGPTQYGEVWVKSPLDRVMGSAARWGVLSVVVGKSTQQPMLVSMNTYPDRAAFLKKVERAVLGSERKEALIFIHGYNQSFADAAVDAAGLATDLELDGVPVLYSWPSQASIFSYIVDVNLAEQQAFIDGLASLIADVSRDTGATRVNIVAHSMGNRFLLKALQQLRESGTIPATQRVATNVVFASPDVDAQDFSDRVSRLRGIASGMTLYASDRDFAIGLSRVANRFPRAGEAKAKVSLPGLLETVDTTTGAGRDFLRHADFSSGARDDLRGLLWLDLKAANRCILLPDTEKAFWVFNPRAPCNEPAFRYAVWFVRRSGNYDAAIAEADRIIALLDFRLKQPDETDQGLRTSLTVYRDTRAVLDQMRKTALASSSSPSVLDPRSGK